MQLFFGSQHPHIPATPSPKVGSNISFPAIPCTLFLPQLRHLGPVLCFHLG